MKTPLLLLALWLTSCARAPEAPSPADAPPDAALESAHPDTDPAQVAILRLKPSYQALPAARAFEAAGVPFCVTTSSAAALRHKLIYLPLDDAGIRQSAPLRAALRAYAEGGGVLLLEASAEAVWPDLTGLDRITPNRKRRSLRLRPTADASLAAFIQPEELDLPLASPQTGEGVWSFGLRPLSGTKTLATFASGEAALTRHDFGSGSVYVLGVSLRDTTLRPQADRDFEAQRLFSNGYEPAADVWTTWLGRLYAARIPNAVRLRAQPGTSKLVLLLSHDLAPKLDFETARRWLAREKQRGLPATWFAQTKTALDATPSPLFDQRVAGLLKEMLAAGHEAASLGVSHGGDFEALPFGIPVEAKDYRPAVNERGRTKGATLSGEATVSKALLDKTLSPAVTSGFRSPLFAYPEALDLALERAGYAYDSSLSAASTLTNRPFRLLAGRGMTRESALLEFPALLENVTPTAKAPGATAMRRLLAVLSTSEGWVVARLRPDGKPGSDVFFETLLSALPADSAAMTMSQAARFWNARAAARWRLTQEGKLELELPAGAPSLSFELTSAPKACAGEGVKARCEGRLVIVDAAGPTKGSVRLTSAPLTRKAR